MISFTKIRKLANESMKKDLPSIRVSLVGDTATQLLGISIRGMGVLRGFNIDLFEADYNQVERQFLDTSSELYQFNSDFIILFQSTHKLLEYYSLSSAEKMLSLAEDRLNFVSSICSNPLLERKKIIYFNYPEIDDTVFGSYANRLPESFTWQVRKLNCGLMDLSRRYQNLFICDLSALQNKLGRDVLFATNTYVNTEMVLSVDALSFVASRVIDIICAIKGQFKKCLILDLDNTVWGGVIGDDGIEGIQLGHGLGIGKAFTEFQMWVKKLKQRGIIICVVSKNNEETAKEPFEKHPDMVLKLDDISVFLANWETKVDNILTIQSILNIGFDSMVFLDDNPFERSIVRDNIKGITVPELPEDPSDYLEYLYSLNLFETASYSNSDKDRTSQYQIEAKRVELSKTFTNEADFLKSLNMISTVSGFNKFNIPRVAQLSQRSNQFNLRTIRYTEADIATYAANSDIVDLCFTLEDRFGDNGLVSVIIMKPLGNDTLFIDTWLMSCRVLKRGMEIFVLNEIVEAARKRGYKKIIGEYLPTSKNSLVKDHYFNLGFEQIPESENDRFILDIELFREKDCFIRKKMK